MILAPSNIGEINISRGRILEPEQKSQTSKQNGATDFTSTNPLLNTHKTLIPLQNMLIARSVRYPSFLPHASIHFIAFSGKWRSLPLCVQRGHIKRNRIQFSEEVGESRRSHEWISVTYRMVGFAETSRCRLYTPPALSVNRVLDISRRTRWRRRKKKEVVETVNYWSVICGFKWNSYVARFEWVICYLYIRTRL